MGWLTGYSNWCGLCSGEVTARHSISVAGFGLIAGKARHNSRAEFDHGARSKHIDSVSTCHFPRNVSL